jgi:hypothetical protein
MIANLNKEQILQVVNGAKTIAKALSIAEEEIFEAMNEHGNITSDEVFLLTNEIHQEKERSKTCMGDMLVSASSCGFSFGGR